jgi:RNA polymerase sigma-70 factor (ECF subfamily)
LETPGWDPPEVPEPTGKRLRHFLVPTSSPSIQIRQLVVHREGCSSQVSKVLSISSVRRSRVSHAVPNRPSLRALAAEKARRAPFEVLNCLPLEARRGKYLQFQSFDASYVERLRAGDFRTQDHFVAYFTELIQIKLRSRLQSPQAIEDVRQETFVRFFTALRAGKILQPERLGSFVNSMCNNVLLEHYRSGARTDSLDDEEGKDFPAKGVDLVGALAAQQTEKKVREIIEMLSERDRRLLREIFLEERDKDDVCRDFGVDREYLRVLLHRAKRAFKSLYLKDMGDEPPQFATARGH